MLKKILAHPLTQGLDVDNPRTTFLRRKIIREKAFLRKIYDEWYHSLAQEMTSVHGVVLELGSGAGFLNQYIPGLLTSEVFFFPGVDIVLDGMCLPLPDNSIGGVALIDVLHHIPDPRQFFCEAARCVKPGGAVVMIEPWVTAWSKVVYTRLHHEVFDWKTSDWKFCSSGPLSGANGAIPYIIFDRDREIFEKQFPMWKIERIVPQMPFRYLMSGGISMRSLAPVWSFRFWRSIEKMLEPWMPRLAMFSQITLRRTNMVANSSVVL